MEEQNQEGGGFIPDRLKEFFGIVDDYDREVKTRPNILGNFISNKKLIDIVKGRTLEILRKYLKELGEDKELSDVQIFTELKRLVPPFLKKELIYMIRYILNIEAEIIKQNGRYEELNSKRNKTRNEIDKKTYIDLRLRELEESYETLVKVMMEGKLSGSMSNVFRREVPPYAEIYYPDETLIAQFNELFDTFKRSPGKRNTRKSREQGRRKYEKGKKTRRTRRQKH